MGDSRIVKGRTITIPKEVREKERKRRFLDLFIDQERICKNKRMRGYKRKTTVKLTKPGQRREFLNTEPCIKHIH